MASVWNIENIDVYVTNHNIKGDVKLAKLTPLDSQDTSTLHFFGSGAEEVELKGWIITEANVTSIKNFRKAGTSVTLTSDIGNEGDFKIADFSFDKYGPWVKLSLTGYSADPSTTNTIYRFTAKLIKV